MSTITIEQEVIPNFQFANVSNPILRIYLLDDFVNSSGVPLQSGDEESRKVFKSVTLTLVGTDLTIPQFTLESTTDGQDINYARYKAVIYNGNVPLCDYNNYTQFRLSHELSTTDWDKIRAFNFTPNQIPDYSSYTKLQVDNLINNLVLGAVSFSSITGQPTDNANLAAALTAKVSTSRTISTTAPLQGGGDLSQNRGLSITKASAIQDGYLASTDFSTFLSKESALTFDSPLSRSVNTVSVLNTTALWNANKLQGFNVSPDAPSNNQALVWNSSTVRWEPKNQSGGSGGGTWGSITGTLSNQEDLQAALDAKLATNGNASSLTNLNATQLTSGTIPDARFPSTLPAISGENLTNLNATNLASGTIADARFPATLPALSGINLTNLNFANITSSTIERSQYGRYLLRDIAAQMGKYRYDGSGLSTIVYIGDSLVQEEFYTNPLRLMLQAQFGYGGIGFVRFDSTGYPIGAAVSTAGTWTERNQSPSALGLHLNDSTSSDTATPASKTISGSACNFDTAVIHFIKKSGGGSFEYRFNNTGSWTAVSTSNATTVFATVTTTVAYGNNVLNVRISSAGTTGVTLIGADLQAGTTGLRLHMIGSTGSTSSQWVAVGAQTWQDGLAALNPNLVFVQFSTNDQSLQIPTSTVQGNFTTLFNRIRTAASRADLVFLSDVPTSNDADIVSYIPTATYSNAIHDTARTLGVSFFDLPKIFESYTNANARGLMDDGAHPSRAGGRLLADYLYGFINNGIGAYLQGGKYVNPITLQYFDGTNGGVINILRSDNSTQSGYIGNIGNDVGIKMTGADGFSLMDSSGTVQFRLLANGTFAAGTPSPFGKFHISPTTAGQIMLYLQGLSGQSGPHFLAVDNTRKAQVAITGPQISLYNLSDADFADSSTNYERIRTYVSSSVFTIASQAGGTGTLRDMSLSAPNIILSGIVKAGTGPTTLTNASGTLKAAALESGAIDTLLPTQTGNSGKFLTTNGSASSWSTVTIPSAANPTASVGLTAVNGSASTFMRSDGAPALDQSIAPTWTGQHIHSISNSVAWSIGPNGNTNPVLRIITNTASQADGLSINGGAAGAGTTITALSSGSNSGIIFTPKGTGSLLSNTDGSATNPAIGLGSGLTNWGLWKSGASSLSIGLAGTERAKLWTDGSFYLNGSNSELQVGASGFITWAGSSTSISRISNGLVGIGTGAAGSFAGSLKMTDATMTGAIINTGITSDATHTDSTVCQDTTTHQFYSGSGTLGVCLGTSSERYKHDLSPIKEGLVDVLKLKPLNYYYDELHGDGGKRELKGFTAEDVFEIMPSLVVLDDKGLPNSLDMLGMVPILVKAIQEQHMIIEMLSTRLNSVANEQR